MHIFLLQIEAMEKISLFSVHVKVKNILILGEGPTKGLDDATLTAETKYPINFTQLGKRFALSLHCNGNSSFLVVNATKVYQFKLKNSEIKDYALKRFVLSLHCNRSNSFLVVNAAKVYQFKLKNSEMKDFALCLGNGLVIY